MRRCSRCENYLEESEFTVSRNVPDGLSRWCKNCTRIGNRRSYYKNREKVLERTSKYQKTKKGKKVSRIAYEAWKSNNLEKYVAHNALRLAVKHGVVKPKPCQECGIKKTQAHHTDYMQPYKVEWLCMPCHKKIHRKDT